jgi:phage/plasmid-like protein (TIGR03299 family)
MLYLKEVHMAHLVEGMAFVHAAPWHGLGNSLSENQPLEVWLREAGIKWNILDAPVHYRATDGLHPFADQKVLYRSDTLQPLSVVSKRYHVVQPREVLEFYRDLVEVRGFELETAGVLKGGKKLWALARTGQEAVLKGGDAIKAYLTA